MPLATCTMLLHPSIQEGVNLENLADNTGDSIRDDLQPKEKQGRKKESEKCTTDELKKEIKMVIL